MSAVTADQRQKEVDENLDFFLSELPRLLPSQRGKFVLLRNRKITAFFDTPLDAVSAANSLYEDQLYSIQQVTSTPVDLGFFSHAGDLGKP